MNAYLLFATTPPAGIWTSAVSMFQRGGPVMWPILIFSFIGICVAIDRLLAFLRYNLANRNFRAAQAETISRMRAGEWEKALVAAESGHAPICRILAEALRNRDAGFLESLEAASQLELTRLRRGLSVLDTIITVEPMLGILGTVTGIINTFNMLNAAGIDNPQGATAGIAEALLTTAAGLIVTIACLFPFNTLIAQLRHVTQDLEQVTHEAELAYNTGCAKK